MSSQNNNSKVSLNKISNLILNEQYDDIKAYTAGHLNENHLFKTTEVKQHRPWKTALRQKEVSSVENLFEKNEFQLSFNNQASTYFLTQRKKSPIASVSSTSRIGININQLKLPYLVKNKRRPNSNSVNNKKSSSDQTDDFNFGVTDKEMAISFLNGPFYGGSKEEKFKNLAKFEKNILQRNDLNATNILHSTSGINLLEKKIEQVSFS
jgi:hypothetical protein